MTKKKQRTTAPSSSTEAAEDARFTSAMNAPIFNKVGGKGAAKVQIDDRFKSILTDDRFRVVPGGSVDAVGRKKKQSQQKDLALQELNRLYKVEDETAAGDEEEEAVSTKKSKKQLKDEKKSSGAPSTEDRLDYLTKLARGEIDGSSDSDSDEEEEEEEEDGSAEEDEEIESDDEDEDVVDEFTKSALAVPEDEEVPLGDATHRVSILNCDWENIKAQDLMVILQSFVPPGRQIRSVTVYPSDFGKQRMAQDALHGPQGIWKAPEQPSESEDEEDDEGGEQDSKEEEESEEDEEDDDEQEQGSVRSRRTLTTKPSDKNNKKKKESKSGFDPQKLREYELSKLRYYFAVADCDSAFTANALYEELDEVELQDSSMALELRFVPDDLDLSARDVRDTCTAVPDNYTPPDFVVNALQHTNVECTWDEGERDREKKLTNLSAWRGMRDSDFMQYIASSDSDDEEDELVGGGHSDEDSDAGGTSMMSVSRKKSRAQSLRAMLLGAAAGAERDSEDEDSEGGARDDFFLQDGEGESEQDDDHDNDNDGEGVKIHREGDEEEMVLTYIPEAGQELLEKRRSAAELANLTPLEASLRREAEKKKEKQALRKAVVEEKKKAQKEQLDQALRKKKHQSEEDAAQDREERERLREVLQIDENDDDDDRLGENAGKKTKKNRKRGKAAKAERAAAAAQDEDKDKAVRANDKIGAGNFQVDLSDERFKKVFQGDATFGIERTAHEFKATPGMQHILETQRKHRVKQQKKKPAVSGGAEEQGGKDVSQLVNRLKRKFQE